MTGTEVSTGKSNTKDAYKKQHSSIHVQSVVKVKQSPCIMEANSKRSLVWC